MKSLFPPHPGRLVWFAAVLLPGARPAWAAFPQIKLEVVCDRQTHSPVVMTQAGDGSGRMFLADQRGTVRIFKNGMLQPGVFLDVGAKLVPERAGFDERGLLGLAFHPGYATAASPGFRRFYVFYSAPSPNAPGTAANPVDCRSVLAEYRGSATDPDKADPTSERILLSFDKPQFNHNGGGLEFGPDGLLYFTAGDGGSSNDNNPGHTGGSAARPTNAKGNAQDLTNLLGKIHRIDPLGTNAAGGQYGIPAGNPFAVGGGGNRPEIFAWGLRNCWRFSFDSRPGGTNRLFAADVGQGAVEEVNQITVGKNYGWRNFEGSFVPDFSIDAPTLEVDPEVPLAEYAHPGITLGFPALPQYGISVTGGFIYRGSAIPSLVGKYVFADWSQSFNVPSGRLLGMEESPPGVWKLAELNVLGGNPVPRFIQGFGQDADGELYVLTKSSPGVTVPDPANGLPSGAVLKIVPVPATTALTLTASRDTTLFQEAENGNGAGEWIFSGATDPTGNNAALRRALLGWNFATVPAGATVASASLSLTMDKTIAPAYAFSLHRMTENWGEGTANANSQEGKGGTPGPTDATWLKPFFGQTSTWAEPGGDFNPAPSATTVVTAENTVTNGIYVWNSPGMAVDVNTWLTTPAGNFGWMLKPDLEGTSKTGNGSSGQLTLTVSDTDNLAVGMVVSGLGIGPGAKIANGGINAATNVLTLTAPHASAVNGNVFFAAPSAKRFISRNSATTASRPRLTLNYVPAPPAPTHRRAWELAGYFTGQYIEDTYDTDGDGIPDGVEYAWGFAPRTRNDPAAGFTVNASAVNSGGPVVLVFRRDPLAVDLTYRVQVSTDLVNWSDLSTSTAGAVPSGTGFVSETAAADAPFRNATVHDIVPVGDTRRIYRLKVTR